METTLLGVFLDVMEKLRLLDPNSLPIFIADCTHGGQCSAVLRKRTGALSGA
jgi:hypothetical protein